ncbi:MAG: hypothetical protein VB021_07155 [Oscillospiraceae bacterium]|nr:hypothetical protein [Oscillospiraceae bacterium]
MDGVEKERIKQTETWFLDTVADPLGALPSYEPELPLRSLLKQLRERLLQRCAPRSWRERYYSARPVDDGVAAALRKHLQALKENGEQPIAVLAPRPGDATLSASDGYMRRVAAVDRSILSGHPRVYLYDSPYWNTTRLRAFYHAPGEYSVIFNGAYASHRAFAASLIAACSTCYIQSVLRVLHAGEVMRELLDVKDVRYILDMHGTVPAEFALNGDAESARAADEAERLCAQKCSLFVTVNEASADYLRARGEDVAAVACPLFDMPQACAEKAPGEAPAVIYAGGLQAWQCIDEMVAAVRACADGTLRYMFLVSDPPALREKLGDVAAQVLSVAPQEMPAYYRQARYGFLLRQDNDVNRYACPTKLLEYLAWGIIPILHSADIGDFAAFGMRYITKDAYVRGQLPSESERAAMAKDNIAVLGRIRAQAARGEEQLKKILCE